MSIIFTIIYIYIYIIIIVIIILLTIFLHRSRTHALNDELGRYRGGEGKTKYFCVGMSV